MKIKFLSDAPAKTKKLGEILAREILKEKKKKTAFILGLKGDLGGGKTTFLQGFARGLGLGQKITSPTFVIMKRFNNFYHIDCYRIACLEEAKELGLGEIISDPQNIVAIEWPERIENMLPRDILMLRFLFVGKKKRKIEIAF